MSKQTQRKMSAEQYAARLDAEKATLRRHYCNLVHVLAQLPIAALPQAALLQRRREAVPEEPRLGDSAPRCNGRRGSNSCNRSRRTRRRWSAPRELMPYELVVELRVTDTK